MRELLLACVVLEGVAELRKPAVGFSGCVGPAPHGLGESKHHEA